MNDQDKLRAALEAMLSKDMTHGREMWPEVQQARATLAALGEKGEAVASPTLPVVIRGKVYDVPIPVHLRIVALEDALEARGTKPFCYVRTLNGAPDWAEDCVCEEPGVVLQYHDEAEGYGEMPLYTHPTAPKQPEALGEVAKLVDRGRAEVDRDTLGTGFLVRGCYVHPSLVEVLVTKTEAQGEAVARLVIIEKGGRKAIRTWDDIGELPPGEHFLYSASPKQAEAVAFDFFGLFDFLDAAHVAVGRDKSKGSHGAALDRWRKLAFGAAVVQKNRGITYPTAPQPEAQAVACKYFSVRPAEGEFNTHDTLDAARADAQDMLDTEGEDGWPDDPPQVCYGIVLAQCEEVEGSRGPAPEGSDYSEVVEYRLVEDEPPPQIRGQAVATVMSADGHIAVVTPSLPVGTKLYTTPTHDGGGMTDGKERVDREVRNGRRFYFRHNPPNTMLAQIFNDILRANGTFESDLAKNLERESAAHDSRGGEVVGHKTVHDGHGGLRHVPLTRAEADAILAHCTSEDERRKALIPDEKSAIELMMDAYIRLKEIGWNDAIYCPKDGRVFEVIEPGSTGIFKCVYQGEWPKGTWWIVEDGDMSPSRPVLFRPLTAAQQQETRS